jgi:hypothetical protein
MFTIKQHPPIESTIGQLCFFRWALECGVIDYMEAHADEIRTGYAAYLKETVEEHKRNKTEKAAPTELRAAWPVEGSRATRRRNKQAPSSLHSLQMINAEVVLEFT